MEFTLNFPTRITKEYILKYTNQESLMQFYLGIPVTKKLYRNPLRNDKYPTASFWRTKEGTLLFHDFAYNKFYSFIDVVREKYKVGYNEALRIIARDLGLISANAKRIVQVEEFKCDTKTSIQVEIRPFLEKELNWWNKYGITESTLKKFNVFSANTVFINNYIYSRNTDYTFGYYFGKRDNIELWKIYFPTRRSNRFIMNCDKTLLQGYSQLPSNGDILVITKSLKDVMLFYELGISSIAPNSETMFLTSKVYLELNKRFNDIYILFDNDYQGITSMNKFRKQFKAEGIDLKCAWIPRKYGAKDISDLYLKVGKERLIELIKLYTSN